MLFSTQLLRPDDTNTRVGPKNMLNVEKKELRELKLTIQLESEKRKTIQMEFEKTHKQRECNWQIENASTCSLQIPVVRCQLTRIID